MALVAQAINFLLAIIKFCWNVFYWGSAIATIAGVTGCIFASYYLFKERHPHTQVRDQAPAEWVGNAVILFVCTFIPILNTGCAIYFFREQKTIIYNTLKKVELECGVAEQ